MFSQAICRAITDSNSRPNPTASDDIGAIRAENLQAVNAAIREFCLSSHIAPPGPDRTMAEVGHDVGNKVKEFCNLGTEAALRSALDLLDSVGHLSYQVLRDLVAQPVMLHGLWNELCGEPITIGTTTFQNYFTPNGQVLFNVDADRAVGPLAPLGINPEHLAEWRGTVYGAFTTSSEAGPGQELVFYDLSKDCKVASIAKLTPQMGLIRNMPANSAGAYLGVIDGAAGLYKVYRLNDTGVVEVYTLGFEPKDESRYIFGGLHVLNDQVYQTVATPGGSFIRNISSGKDVWFRSPAKTFREPAFCNGSIYLSVSEEGGWAIYNISSGERIHFFPQRVSGELVEFKGSLFQGFGEYDNAVVFNVISREQLFLKDGTKVTQIERAGGRLFLTTRKGEGLFIYDFESGERVGLESPAGKFRLTDVRDCNGHAYQITRIGDHKVTYNLSLGKECFRTAGSNEVEYPVAANGRVFQTVGSDSVRVHYDLETGSRILHGADRIYLPGDGSLIFRDAESMRQYKVPLDLV